MVARRFQPVDSAPVIFFRVAFGLVLTWEVWRYFSKGWIERDYIQPEIRQYAHHLARMLQEPWHPARRRLGDDNRRCPLQTEIGLP